jgi:hypothetical protein
VSFYHKLVVPNSDNGKSKPKPRNVAFSLLDELHRVEYSLRLGSAPPVYKFEVGRFLPNLSSSLHSSIEGLISGIDRARVIYTREIRTIQELPNLRS